jgi:DNA-directed RNA polymerase beta subunit
LRRKGIISPYTFISCNRKTRCIRVTLQSGILCRPLLIIGQQENIDPNASLMWLLANGIIEYVSPSEQQSLCRIAVTSDQVTPATTHIEITQASFLGKMASSVAFATGQQGPRLAYSTLQKKQIITGSKKRYRGAPDFNQLWNTHRPLVYSKTELMANSFHSRCRGVPVVMAIMALPQNQEDALIMKKGTLDRGAFRMFDNRDYVSEAANPCIAKSEIFEKPSSVISKKTSSYEYIGENGLPLVGTLVPGGSVIIGKTRNVKRASLNKEETSTMKRKCDISTCCKPGDDGIVTSVDEATMPNGKRVRVVMTVTRTPSIGDKFTSQYAQKGVIGAIWNDADMPYSVETGVSPDIIVSPLSMTSRMTMSSLLEALCGKTVSVTGNYDLGCDHQEYHKSNTILHKQMGAELKKYGFSTDGTEKYIDGRTGEMIHARIFTGVVDYYRLVHIASKKIHARSTGPRNPLTRQPRDGRRFGGGLRIGEMESSALAAHGSSHVLQERFRELSDSFEIFVCSTCKLLCDDVCKEIGYHFCRQCQQNNTIRSVLVPFTFLVLTLELLSTGIQVQFDIADE